MIDAMESLVDKSLLRQEDAGGEARFRMLETIREYAREQLEASGEAERLRAAHATYYLALAERAAAKLRGPEQVVWLDRLEDEHDNLRAALAWYLGSGDATHGLRLVGALGWFWLHRGFWTEGRRWLADMLALPGAPTEPRAAALTAAGALAEAQDDQAAAVAFLEESVVVWRHVGDRSGLALALSFLSGQLGAGGRPMGEESVLLAREAGDDWVLAVALVRLGDRLFEHLRQSGTDAEDLPRYEAFVDELGPILRRVDDPYLLADHLDDLRSLAMRRGNRAAARAHLEDALARFRGFGATSKVAATLDALAGLAWDAGDYDEARRLCEQCLELRRDLGNRFLTGDVTHHIGVIARRQGDPATADRLVGESLRIFRELDAEGNRRARERMVSALCDLARHALDRADYDAARSLAEEALKVGQSHPDIPPQSLGGPRHFLGRAAVGRGDLGAAETLFRSVLAAACDIRAAETANPRRGVIVAISLEDFAILAAARGEPVRALRLLSAATTERVRADQALSVPDRALVERWLSTAREVLGEDMCQAALAEGGVMSLDAAIAYALEEVSNA